MLPPRSSIAPARCTEAESVACPPSCPESGAIFGFRRASPHIRTGVVATNLLHSFYGFL
jgi:hypothetical protein